MALVDDRQVVAGHIGASETTPSSSASASARIDAIGDRRSWEIHATSSRRDASSARSRCLDASRRAETSESWSARRCRSPLRIGSLPHVIGSRARIDEPLGEITDFPRVALVHVAEVQRRAAGYRAGDDQDDREHRKIVVGDEHELGGEQDARQPSSPSWRAATASTCTRSERVRNVRSRAAPATAAASAPPAASATTTAASATLVPLASASSPATTAPHTIRIAARTNVFTEPTGTRRLAPCTGAPGSRDRPRPSRVAA